MEVLYPVGIYLLKVNNRNTRTRYEICSKLTVKTPDWDFPTVIVTPWYLFLKVKNEYVEAIFSKLVKFTFPAKHLATFFKVNKE